MSRKILAVTGIRSEYDLMSTVYQKINEHPELTLELLVTGAHLSPSHGYTLRDIERDGFVVADQIESLIQGDSLSSRIKGLGIQLQGMIQSVVRAQPDMLLVLGDREEAMTTALVGAYMNIPVAHVAGGDRVIGNVDDQVRHAVTKLAHLHFVTNEDSYKRVLALGEEPFRTYNTGNPGLDRLLTVPHLTPEQLSERLGFIIEEDEPIILLIQHVISTEVEHAYDQMKQTLEAVSHLGIKTILSYPNSDAGSQQLIRAIQEYEHLPHLFTAKNIPRLEFVNIMRRATCMLGNSSAGILEAPILKLPVVNVGNRQKGRLHADNVQFVEHDIDNICYAVRRAIYDDSYRHRVENCVNPYGDGHSSEAIVHILASIPIDDKLLIKEMTY